MHGLISFLYNSCITRVSIPATRCQDVDAFELSCTVTVVKAMIRCEYSTMLDNLVSFMCVRNHVKRMRVRSGNLLNDRAVKLGLFALEELFVEKGISLNHEPYVRSLEYEENINHDLGGLDLISSTFRSSSFRQTLFVKSKDGLDPKPDDVDALYPVMSMLPYEPCKCSVPCEVFVNLTLQTSLCICNCFCQEYVVSFLTT